MLQLAWPRAVDHTRNPKHFSSHFAWPTKSYRSGYTCAYVYSWAGNKTLPEWAQTSKCKKCEILYLFDANSIFWLFQQVVSVINEFQLLMSFSDLNILALFKNIRKDIIKTNTWLSWTLWMLMLYCEGCKFLLYTTCNLHYYK